jgi:hypothetical protein
MEKFHEKQLEYILLSDRHALKLHKVMLHKLIKGKGENIFVN